MSRNETVAVNPSPDDIVETPKDPSHYPDPFVVEPTGEHKQSWIVLHGRGDNARSFSTGYMGFLTLPLPDGRTLQEHLPHVRFVFPSASHRRARVFNDATYPQWFDIYSWHSDEKSEWQVEGLSETTAWIHALMRQEIEAVGAQNVILGGLSQGCASSLISLLLWEGSPIRCVFGMSGWLPFRHVLELFVDAGERENAIEEDAFERDDIKTKMKERDGHRNALRALCEELEVQPVSGDAARRVPILLVHGKADDTVEIECGLKATGCIG